MVLWWHEQPRESISCRGAASFQPQVDKFRLYLTAAALTVTACMRRQQCPVRGAGAGDRAWHACGEAPDRRARQHEKLVRCELIRLGGRAVRASKIGRPCRDSGCCPDDVGSPAGGEGRCCTCIAVHLTSLRGLRSGRSGCNFTAFGGLRARRGLRPAAGIWHRFLMERKYVQRHCTEFFEIQHLEILQKLGNHVVIVIVLITPPTLHAIIQCQRSKL